jgi:hypothetical protein
VPLGVVVGHEDAPQIRVPPEGDAEEVVDLALQPVGGVPERHHGVDLQRIHREQALHPQRPPVRDGPELIDHLDRLPSAIIHGRHVLQQIVPVGGIVPEPGEDLDVAGRVHVDDVLVPGVHLVVADGVAEALEERGHARGPGAGSVRGSRTLFDGVQPALRFVAHGVRG